MTLPSIEQVGYFAGLSAGFCTLHCRFGDNPESNATEYKTVTLFGSFVFFGGDRFAMPCVKGQLRTARVLDLFFWPPVSRKQFLLPNEPEEVQFMEQRLSSLLVNGFSFF